MGWISVLKKEKNIYIYPQDSEKETMGDLIVFRPNSFGQVLCDVSSWAK